MRAKSWQAIRRLVPRSWTHRQFRSADYWESRYQRGRRSGSGSRGILAEFKAEILNAFVTEHGVASVVELGCGDGEQLGLASYPSYVGLDVSATVLGRCEERFAGDAAKSFRHYDCSPSRADRPLPRGDLALSLDVIYHLVEDDVFETYMHDLFGCAERFVIIYSSNEDKPGRARHVRHRRFTDWIDRQRPEWRLVRHVANRFPERADAEGPASPSDFFIYALEAGGTA